MAHRARLIKDMAAFVLVNRKWWLAPIFVVLLLLAALVVVSTTAVAPFIYTLF